MSNSYFPRINTAFTSANIDYARVQQSQEVSSVIQGAGAVALAAGQDVTLHAAQVQAQGALSVAAAGSVLVEAGQSSFGMATGSQGSASGLFSSTTVTQQNSSQSTTAQASELGGHTVAIAAGKDVRVTGSQVLADQDNIPNRK